MTEDATTLDATKGGDTPGVQTDSQILDTLYANSAAGTPVPSLATSYQLSPDKLTWTFKLRPGVRFSNGQRLTSADVKFSLAAAAKSTVWGFLAPIASITTPDPQTVVIKTKGPQPAFLSELAWVSNGIVPKNYDGQSSAKFWTHPIGSGPFEFDHWAHGTGIYLKRNPYYWQSGRPLLAGVAFLNQPDDNSRIAQLQGSQIEVAERPPIARVKQLSSTPGLRLVAQGRLTQLNQLIVNVKHSPLGDLKVREAISMAIDSDAIVRTIQQGYGAPARSIVPPSAGPLLGTVPPLAYDPARAKALMAASSARAGFSATLLYFGGDSYATEVSQLLQQELAALGIRLKLRGYDPAAFYSAVGAGKFDLALDLELSPVGDPSALVGSFVSSHLNYAGIDDPEIQRLTQQAQTTFGDAARTALYVKWQERQQQLMDPIPVTAFPNLKVASDRVHDLGFSSTGIYRLADTWLSTGS